MSAVSEQQMSAITAMWRSLEIERGLDVTKFDAAHGDQRQRIPAGLTEVTRDVFYAQLMTDTRNVQYRPERYHGEYTLGQSRELWGWRSRGYSGPFDWQGAPAEVFALSPGALFRAAGMS